MNTNQFGKQGWTPERIGDLTASVVFNRFYSEG